MRPMFFVILLLASVGASVAQNATTALSALRLVPKADARQLARIEGREGSPTPERWHILVHDPKEQTGLREYVVSGGEVIASRALSQFVETLKAEDVMEEAVKVDSDRAGRLAQDYARANKMTATTFSYQLKTQGRVPQWTVGCVDEGGRRIGEVIVQASDGSVVSHAGFLLEPPPERPEPIASNEDGVGERERLRREARSTPRRTSARGRVLPAGPTPQPERPNTLRKIGDSFGRIFGR